MIGNIYLRRSIFAVLGILILVVAGAIAYPFLPSPTVEGYKIRGAVKEVSQNADIGVGFSQPMDKSSVKKYASVEKLVLKDDVKELVKGKKVVDYEAMLRPGKVEENFDSEGEVAGDFVWKGSTLVFEPDDGLREGEFYRVKVGGEARSLIQKTVGKDYEEFFKVVESPKVVMATPGIDSVVPVDTRVTVQFNRPMVALTSIDEGEDRALPVTFDPPVEGRGKWLGTTAFQFIPDKLDYSTEYKVTVAEGAKSIDGGQVDDGFELVFETPRPELKRTYPSSGSDDNGVNPNLFLVFNQSMDVGDLQRNLEMYQTDNEKEYLDLDIVDGEFGDEWKAVDFFVSRTTDDEYKKLFEMSDDYELTDADREEMKRMVTVKATRALELDKFFVVRVKDGVKGAEGDLGLDQRDGFKFKTAAKPAVMKTDPADGEENVKGGAIEIEFNNPMDLESLKKAVSIDPAPVNEDGEKLDLGEWLSYDKHFYYIYPAVEPASEYVVKISGDAEDVFGQKLGKDVEAKFKTGDLDPSVDVESRDELAMLNGYKDPVFYVRTTNVDKLKFNFKALSVENFERMYRGGYWDMYGESVDEPLTPWVVDVKDEKNKKITSKINFDEVSGDLVPGIYYFDVADESNSDKYWERQAFLYTKTALTYKSEPGRLLVWATDVESGQPIEGMQIVAKRVGEDEKYVEVAQGFTNADGIVSLEVPEGDNSYSDREFLVYGYRDGDFTVLHTNWNDGIEPWNFNIESRYKDDDFYTYLYTDRPIYRPGHKVYFKGIVRGNDDAMFNVPKGKKVNVVVNDSRGNELMNKEMELNKNGTFNGELMLAPSVPTGNFSIRVTVLGENEEVFFGGFKVAEYRKPDYKVEIEPDKSDYVDGDKAQLKVNVDYYFGAPLADADVRWSLQRMDYFFNEFEGEWYSFSEDGYFCYWGCEGSSETVTQGQGKTNENGELVIDLPIDITQKEMSQLYKLEVTAEDITGRSVSNRVTFPVHKGEYYVGINNKDYVVKVGEDAVFDLVSVDFDGKPVGGKKSRVVFSKREWNTVRKQNVDGGYYYTNGYEDKEIDVKEVTTDSKGQAEVSFGVDEGGLYRAVVESVDSKGNKITSGTNVYVGSGSYIFWGRDNNDRIELVPDKQEYKPGETAKVLIKSPYHGVKALVTYERGKVLDYRVIDLDSNSKTLEIPVTEDMVPNMFVSVVLVKGNGQLAGIEEAGEGASKDEKEKAVEREIEAFKVGYTTLFVDTLSKKLDVEVKTDREQYGPRDEVVVSIETKNAEGRGVPAEVSVAVVDESVLALTETFTADLINYFYRNRMLSVQTAQTLTKAMGRINVLLAAGLKGGGGGATDSGSGVRSEFKDSAHWEAVVETDAEGKAEVRFEVPDNLTTWQLLAIGVDDDTRVGSKKASFVVTKDVLVQPVLPRFVTVGDEVEIGVLMHNQTEKAVTDEVKLVADGVEILAGGDVKSVRVGPGEKKQVMWRVKALAEGVDGGEVKMRFENKFDTLEMNLPVHASSFAEVVATSGVISDDGIWREQVYLPEVVNDELGGLEVQVSPTLAGSLGEGTEYLMRYPYGCSEQTASSLLPNLVLKRVLDLPVISEDLVDVEKLDKNVEAGLQRLYRYQNVNGGWGLWEESDPNLYLTAYVLYTLDAAQEAGYKVDERVIVNGVGYLRNSINSESVDGYYRANSRAYALYVMAVLGQGDLGLTNNLYEKKDFAGIYGKAVLAMTYHELLGQGELDEAVVNEIQGKIERLKTDVLNRQRASAREVQFREDDIDYRSFDSDVRTTAFVLQMMNKVDVENPVNDKIVRFLMESRKDGHWRTTQDTSMVLLALVDFLQNSGELNPDFVAKILVNDEEKLKMEFGEDNLDEKGNVSIAMSEMGAESEVGVSKDGDGKLYYDLVLKYFLPPEEVSVKDQGLTVSQQYFDLDDEDELKPLDGFKLGQVVKSKVVVVVPEERYYVVVEDILPGGLEAMDFSLETTEKVAEPSESWRWWNNLWYFNHTEFRDDRVLYFADFLPAGTYEIEYYARATSEGEFNDLPAQSFEMYTPEVLGHTAARKVKVTNN